MLKQVVLLWILSFFMSYVLTIHNFYNFEENVTKVVMDCKVILGCTDEKLTYQRIGDVMKIHINMIVLLSFHY